MAPAERIEELACILFTTSIAPGTRWTWDMEDEERKNYWRNLAKIAWNVFNRRGFHEES